MEKTKVVFTDEVICPHCNKHIKISKTKTLANEPIKPEYDEEIKVEKVTDIQSTVDDFGTKVTT